MSNLLQTLENNEAILLMYLAGELPEEDRAEVEQMLTRDAGMRAALGDLAALQDELGGVLARADVVQVVSGREAAARFVSRAIVERAARPAAAPAPTAPVDRRFRVPWWTYPIAAAAIVLVAVIMTSGNRPMRLGPTQPDFGGVGNPQVAVLPPNLAPAPTPTDAVVETSTEVFIIPATSTDDSLARLERELLSVRTPSAELDIFGAAAVEGDQ
jgi:hypothetical protein